MTNPFSVKLCSIRSRCNNPKDIHYKWYGGKGVKCLLSVIELEFLWHRDYAAGMKKPSIDRIDSNGHYELSNCRFIEHSTNASIGNKGRTAWWLKEKQKQVA